MSLSLRRLVAAVAILACASAASAQSYRVVRVAPLPGATSAILNDLNNQLQGVGFSGGRPFFWDGTRTYPIPISDVIGTLAINNAGVIAGTRRVGGRIQLFLVINGRDYVDLPTPQGGLPDQDVVVRDLTDSGIVFVQDRPSWMNGIQSWAVFRATLYNLSPLGRITAIGEDGRVAGLVGCDSVIFPGNPPFMRWPDGRTVTPWSTPCAPVAVIGSGGHFAGYSPSGTVQHPWYYGRPDGSVTVVPPLGIAANGMSFGGMNRAGDLVGLITQHADIRDYPFVYTGGRLLDLGALVGTIADVSPVEFVGLPSLITDDGVILTATATDPRFASLPAGQAVLIPRAPGVPPRVAP